MGSVMIGGASFGEIGFVAFLVGLVVLARIAPRVGEALGALFEKHEHGPRR